MKPLIDRHKECIKLLEAIDSFERAKQGDIDVINQTQDLFIGGLRKTQLSVQLTDRAINRLWKFYEKKMKEINNINGKNN